MSPFTSMATEQCHGVVKPPDVGRVLMESLVSLVDGWIDSLMWLVPKHESTALAKAYMYDGFGVG